VAAGGDFGRGGRHPRGPSRGGSRGATAVAACKKAGADSVRLWKAWPRGFTTQLPSGAKTRAGIGHSGEFPLGQMRFHLFPVRGVLTKKGRPATLKETQAPGEEEVQPGNGWGTPCFGAMGRPPNQISCFRTVQRGGGRRRAGEIYFTGDTANRGPKKNEAGRGEEEPEFRPGSVSRGRGILHSRRLGVVGRCFGWIERIPAKAVVGWRQLGSNSTGSGAREKPLRIRRGFFKAGLFKIGAGNGGWWVRGRGPGVCLLGGLIDLSGSLLEPGGFAWRRCRGSGASPLLSWNKVRWQK